MGKINTGLKGLDLIFNNKEFPPPQARQGGYRLLIRGLPGTGKTTLGLHLIERKLNNEINAKGLIIYCQEQLPQLDALGAQFNLSFTKNPPDTFRASVEEFEKGFPSIREWIYETEKKGIQNRYILIDGLSLIKSVDSQHIHRYLLNLLTEIPLDHTLLMVIAESDILAGDYSLEHQVDGIINLSIDDGPIHHRFIEVSKLRYIDHIRGKHGLEIIQSEDNDSYSILNIFPKSSTFFDNTSTRCSTSKKYFINPGIEGLEDIIGSNKSCNPDKSVSCSISPGDVFVVTTEPGTDKIGMGLSFLQAAMQNNHKEKAIWVSFGPWQISNVLSNSQYDKSYLNLKNSLSQDNLQLFAEIDRQRIGMHPDRIVNNMVNSLNKNGETISRVVVEGLTNIAWEFGTSQKVTEYTIWVARLLKKYNAIGYIFIDLPSSFQPLGSIPMEWEAEADFVGHLRWFEINNQLTMSFVLSKSKFSDFRSVPYYVQQKKEKEDQVRISLEDRGWPMINMISGRIDTIHEAKVFLKFFDQNYSARNVHHPVLEEFITRYTSDQEFKHVFRTTPSPKHWSFRGYAGAGHSNTKVVCLKQYIMDILENDQLLVQFPEDEWNKYQQQTKNTLPNLKERDARSYGLLGLTKRSKAVEKKMIPLYADIGVLCSQINKEYLLSKAESEGSGSTFKFYDSVPQKVPSSWDNLFTMNKKFYEDNKNKPGDKTFFHPPWIRFIYALPSLTSDSAGFMAFFLEVLVSFYNKSIDGIYDEFTKDGLKEIIASDAFGDTIRLLRCLVLAKISETPLTLIHYHTAYFSRRWFSKVDQYPSNDPKIPNIEKNLKSPDDPDYNEKRNLKKRFFFDIHPLPSVTNGKENNYGFSCLDIYSIGIIRQALAPETAWMFISELASSHTDIDRFHKRRGLPIIRENWSAPIENKQRESDCEVIDKILDKDRFFCNFWIPNYWFIESKLFEILREIFMGIEPLPVNDIPKSFDEAKEELKKLQLTDVNDIRKQFMSIL